MCTLWLGFALPFSYLVGVYGCTVFMFEFDAVVLVTSVHQQAVCLLSVFVLPFQ